MAPRRAGRTQLRQGCRILNANKQMKHALSTHLFVNNRLTSVWLDRIWDAGVPAVEIFCAKQHLDWRDHGQVAELGHWFRDSELKLHSAALADVYRRCLGTIGPASRLEYHRTGEGKAYRRCGRDQAGVGDRRDDSVPLHGPASGRSAEEFDERKVEAAFTSLEELTVFARQRGVEILLENIPNGFSSSDKLRIFLAMTHLDLNFCFDIGHAHIAETVEGEYNSMKTRIRSTHIHDNDGKEDKHLFPFVAEGGTIDWAQTVRLLASRPEQYPLLLELKEAPGVDQPLDP